MESHSSNPEIIVIAGPTASGKTSFSIELAKRMNAEVISADCRQVYRYMDIGTAKPLRAELSSIPHYGFDVVDPDQSYSAGEFAEDGRCWIDKIQAKKRSVIIAGGSGLYVQALVDGFSGDKFKDETVRTMLEHEESTKGLNSLYDKLISKDPEYAAITMANDRQRILRALEVFEITGTPFSEIQKRPRKGLSEKVSWLGLTHDREILYDRINRRVLEMVERGLIAEVRSLLDRGYRGTNAMKSVGYAEIVDMIDDAGASLESAIDQIQQNTRHYAKRQLTWFKRNERIQWLNSIAEMNSFLENPLFDN